MRAPPKGDATRELIEARLERLMPSSSALLYAAPSSLCIHVARPVSQKKLLNGVLVLLGVVKRKDLKAGEWKVVQKLFKKPQVLHDAMIKMPLGDEGGKWDKLWDDSMACTKPSIASSDVLNGKAKPPSSPTAVEIPSLL